MPIVCEQDVRVITQDEFHSIDYEVMEQVFGLHNELGRFHDEKIHQKALVSRCRDIGFENLSREVPIHVRCDRFKKTYFVDILVNDSALYELKTVAAIVGSHRTQALNYLLLLGLRHGKIINMQPNSVEYAFVSTTLTPEQRFEFVVDDEEWQNTDKDSIWLRKTKEYLLNEWGVFLDVDLFCEAVTELRGGVDQVLHSVQVVHRGIIVGCQKMHLLNSHTAFKLSAVTDGLKYYETHLRRFLRHTEIRAVQWVNFNRHKVEFRTISR